MYDLVCCALASAAHSEGHRRDRHQCGRKGHAVKYRARPTGRILYRFAEVDFDGGRFGVLCPRHPDGGLITEYEWDADLSLSPQELLQALPYEHAQHVELADRWRMGSVPQESRQIALLHAWNLVYGVPAPQATPLRWCMDVLPFSPQRWPNLLTEADMPGTVGPHAR